MLALFYQIGIIISFFLCLLLLGKKPKTGADKMLAFWMFFIGLHVEMFYLLYTGKLFEYPDLMCISLPFPMMHGPFLFFYTFLLTHNRWPRFWPLHLVPALGTLVYMIPFYLLPNEQKVWIMKNNGIGYEGLIIYLIIGNIISGIIYIYMCYLQLNKHQKRIGDLYSNQEKINLKWLQYLIYGLGGIWIAVMIGYDPLIYAFAVIFVLVIGYFGIRQPGIFTNITLPDPDPESDKKKYEKSGLTEDAAQELHTRLDAVMKGEQLYRESELSLSDLANKLSTHPNYLSQVINEKEGKNFYDYINSMRIEAFLNMASMPESRRFTLLALALECGFNSKSAFNRYFKKVKGQAPSEYLNEEAV